MSHTLCYSIKTGLLYFKGFVYNAAKILNELTNYIRIKAGTNVVKKKPDRLSFDCYRNFFFHPILSP